MTEKMVKKLLMAGALLVGVLAVAFWTGIVMGYRP